MGSNGSCCSCEEDTRSSDIDDRTLLQQGLRKKLPGEFTVVVDRRAGAGLGIDASPEKDGTLEVRNIQADGLVHQWNQKQPNGSDEIVRKGMRIVEVNGRSTGALQLIQACKDLAVLHIVVAPRDGFEDGTKHS
mmetsp:Transcript_60292/g.143664  ORF Transcript_60292/g.143664 Transcript_60292/m.143664 type:complete len:134 (+) Transcript_60292:124-525(+)|eukprot:CAMPEP_0178423260 /NCGR_PEP_ID=MMETSP0689_2-20121128/27596_1 /TAXON_ID=160604 /ORGANISM="Amphidinium massartii, Strain CS-259" /LENGTH=133 /DNA_ID=CAMNT_0020044847 /DNA_START=112 /DNA_END=513 /DNA_ORIENTATION=+